MVTPTIVKDMPAAPEEERSNAAEETGPGVDAPHEQSVATLSNPWEFDAWQPCCTSCRGEFNPISRRHHCRLCGKIFCNNCTDQRALIPPSSIVLSPQAGKKAGPQEAVSFSPDPDPDRMLTYIDEDQQLLYGKGLEERFQLAREPLRVCIPCCDQLQPIQDELRNANSNAMRFNHIDPTDHRRFFNSPLAFTLGHEVRKAAYTLNNLLPMPKKFGSVIDTDNFLSGEARELQQCRDECATVGPNLSSLDGVKIPGRLLEQAKGIAVMTVVKGGFGLAGVEFGTGLAVARVGDQQWSAPCAIGMVGLSWGGKERKFLCGYYSVMQTHVLDSVINVSALLGAQVCDHVFLLMTDAAVELMFSNTGNVQLGVDVGVAVGPLGRAVEADLGAAPGTFAPIYTYSLSKGLYAGISVDGKIIRVRDRVNEKFYGRNVSPMEFLLGQIPTPPAARPLYDALQRCHVYASGNSRHRPTQAMPTSSAMDVGYGGQPVVMPPARNDAHSYAGMSDITSNPGY
jgi:lipid-binding SYLF domain-containing protein